jgi:hypothetical protein
MPLVPTDRSEKSEPSTALARSISVRWRRTPTWRRTMRPVASDSTMATGTSAKLSTSRSSTGAAARRSAVWSSPGSA